MEEILNASQDLFPWDDVFSELETKHGSMPKSLKRGIELDIQREAKRQSCFPENLFKKSDNSSTQSLSKFSSEQTDISSGFGSNSTSPDCFEGNAEGMSSSEKELREAFCASNDQTGNLSPNPLRRSPCADSGCSVGSSEDFEDDDVTGNDLSDAFSHRRLEKMLRKVKEDMKDISDMGVRIAKKLIFAFDILEDIKYQMDAGSMSDSKESLSLSSVGGSRESVLSSDRTQRQRQYFLGRFSKSTPENRIGEVLSRPPIKRSHELADLSEHFDERYPRDIYDSSTPKSGNNVHRRGRRASGDDSTMRPKKQVKSLHKRASSVDQIVDKDEWVEDILAIDRTRRETDGHDEFAKLVKEETLQFQAWTDMNDMRISDSTQDTTQVKGENTTDDVNNNEQATCESLLSETKIIEDDNPSPSIPSASINSDNTSEVNDSNQGLINQATDMEMELLISHIHFFPTPLSTVDELATVVPRRVRCQENSPVKEYSSFVTGNHSEPCSPVRTPDKLKGWFNSTIRRSYHERRDKSQEPIMAGVTVKRRPESMTSLDLKGNSNSFGRNFLNRLSLKRRKDSKESDEKKTLLTSRVQRKQSEETYTRSVKDDEKQMTQETLPAITPPQTLSLKPLDTVNKQRGTLSPKLPKVLQPKRPKTELALSPHEWIKSQPMGKFV